MTIVRHKNSITDSQGLYELEEIFGHGITHSLKIRLIFIPEKGKALGPSLFFGTSPLNEMEKIFGHGVTHSLKIRPVFTPKKGKTLGPSLFFCTGHLGYHPCA
jgi:hypothetical protein